MLRALAMVIAAGLVLMGPARAETVHVAVAANFTQVAEDLAAIFEAETGHQIILSFGATGQLYNQALQGAPYQVFLSADGDRPAQAIADGIGVEGTVFTYATGRLALYSTALDLADAFAVLEAGQFNHLAIADPETAPYGRAAIETLTALGLLEALTPKLVTGENITQALQFVGSGNAELSFVAASQVVGQNGVWLVPNQLHMPILQDAVLLKTGEGNLAAGAFIRFLRSGSAVAVIEAAGYTVPQAE